jgi:predicted RNA binding protein YcfA (HicA-like mRNA interferase family)
MGERIRQMNATEVERILRRYDFELVSQKGSHRKWRNETENLQVIVPMHKSRNLPIGTLRNILITAEIPDEEWKTEN